VPHPVQSTQDTPIGSIRAVPSAGRCPRRLRSVRDRSRNLCRELTPKSLGEEVPVPQGADTLLRWPPQIGAQIESEPAHRSNSPTRLSDRSVHAPQKLASKMRMQSAWRTAPQPTEALPALREYRRATDRKGNGRSHGSPSAPDASSDGWH